MGHALTLPQANREMGIRPSDADDADRTSSAFSEDVLKIEICGPNVSAGSVSISHSILTKSSKSI